MSERYKKTLIAPKVRLLLHIYLLGYPKNDVRRKELEKKLEYDKGNLSCSNVPFQSFFGLARA